MVIRLRKPKKSSKKPMRVKEVKKKKTGQGNRRNEVVKWAGTQQECWPTKPNRGKDVESEPRKP